MSSTKPKAILLNISGVGDVVSSLVVANSLKNTHDIYYLLPDAYQGLLAASGFAEGAVSNLPTEQFDLLVDLTSNKRSRSIVKRLKANRKIGRAKNWLHRIKFRHVYTIMVSKTTKSENIVEDYWPILNELGFSESIDTSLSQQPPLHQSKQISIHIGADNEYRRIPEETIIELCKHFRNNNHTVRLIGTEKEIADRILQQVGHNSGLIYETGSLRDVKNWLSESRLVIAPDSGILHLSGALNVPAIGLYGPNTVARAGSPSTSVHYIELDYDCRPCNQKQNCPFNVQCMKNISVQQITTLASDIIAS